MSIGGTTLTHVRVGLVGPLDVSNEVVREIPLVTNVNNSAGLPDENLKLVGAPLNLRRSDEAHGRALSILPNCVE